MRRRETAPHNRTCREAFPLLLLLWWLYLARGILAERRARKAAR